MPKSFSFNTDRTVLGTVFTNAGAEEFALSEIDRTKHLLAIGKTGKGKTTMLSNIALQDIHGGRGVAIIDPHGDLSRTLLEQFPSSRAADLVYIDPADEERIVTFNVLTSVHPSMIAAASSAIVGAWRALWMDSWGYRMERLLYNATAALIEAPNTSLLEVGGSDGETIAREIGLKNVDALTDQADGEAWAKHATYGGPYHPRLMTAIETGAEGRNTALKQNRLRNTFPRVRVDEKIARFLAPTRYSSNIVD